jgi:hypothetical protein
MRQDNPNPPPPSGGSQAPLSAPTMRPDNPAVSVPANYHPASPVHYINAESSSYVPLDNWVYPALDRLSSLGYLDSAFFGLRPWTRNSIVHMLQETSDKIDDGANNDEARGIYLALMKEFSSDMEGRDRAHAELDSVYDRVTGIAGADPLTNSFNFGQTIINDDGRPFGGGFNNIAGIHARAEVGRFSLNVRGEYQHAPGYAALPSDVQSILANNIGIISCCTVLTPADQFGVGTRDDFRLIDANLSFHWWGNEISFGKGEIYWGPGQGGSMMYSNNSEPIYTFRINRVEPLRIPGVSRILGPLRWDNYIGSLHGDISPRDPWTFANKISFHPFRDFEIGGSRECTFGGKGYVPVTVHTFLRCFFSTSSNNIGNANHNDPGDRRTSLDFRWRLPRLQNWVTIYADSIADDDVAPAANFRRSGWAPGIYVSHLGSAGLLSKMDLRFETPYTNQPHQAGINYTNNAYRDGWTNKGVLIGDWIGRDSTGYQGWLTYWLSPSEHVQLQYRDAKIDHALWAGGGSQTDFGVNLVKRLGPDVELNGLVQYERYLIPILKPGAQNDTSISLKVTWYPQIERKVF